MNNLNENSEKKWPIWLCKVLQPLSTETERSLEKEWGLCADDSRFAPMGQMEMKNNIECGISFQKMKSKGYFYGTIYGPGDYLGIYVSKTPYAMPLLVIELEHDVLQKETQETWEDQETDVHVEGGVK